MATQVPGYTATFPAGEDLSAQQFNPVMLNAAGEVITATQGALCVGILQNKPAAAGAAAQVMVHGISKANSGAIIDVSANRRVTAGAGDGVETAATGDFPLGICLATGDTTSGNQLTEVLLLPTGTPLP